MNIVQPSDHPTPSASVTKPVTGRLLWLDVARGLGMLAIVLGHSDLVPHGTEAYRVLFSFHVPLFFMLSGLMQPTSKPWPAFAASRARSLLWPYLLVSLTVAWVSTGKSWIAGHDPLATAVELMGRVAWAGAPMLQWPTLWFVPHLFLASLVTQGVLQGLSRWLPRSTQGWGTTTAAIGLLWAGLQGLHTQPWPTWPWSADLLLVSVAFMMLGHALRSRLLNQPLPRWVTALCVTGFVLLHGRWDDTLDLYLRHADTPWRVGLQALLGFGAVVGLAQEMASAPRWRALLSPLVELGEGSLFVLMFHAWVLVMARQLLVPMGEPAANVLSVLLACAVPLMLRQGVRRVGWLTKLWEFSYHPTSKV